MSVAWWSPSGVVRRGARRVLRDSASLADRCAGWLARAAHLPDEPHLVRNAELRDCHRGRVAFVLGPGASLTHLDPAPFQDQIVFMAQGSAALAARGSPLYVALDATATVDRSALGGARTLLPLRGWAGGLPPLPPHCWVFPVDPFEGPNEAWTLEGLVPDWSATQLAIAVAITAGCRPICLLGMDHNELAEPAIGYGARMAAQREVWRKYEALGRRASQQGTQILNATPGGTLDLFPRLADWKILLR